MDENTSWSRRVLTAASIGALLLVVLLGVRELATLLLLFFAGVVLAAFLRAIADPVRVYTRMPPLAALASTVVGLVALGVAAGYVLVPRVVDQLVLAPTHFAEVRQNVAQYISETPWLNTLMQRVQTQELVPSIQQVLRRALGVFSSVLGIIGGLAFVTFVGLYLAAAPREYLETALLLVPPGQRPKLERAATDSARALQRWVLGRLLSMAIVGFGTALGLWIVGLKLALSLGFFAGVLSFIPYIGPVIAAVPAVLLAIPQGLMQVVWVGVVYVSVQALESYVITPQIQHRAVRIAPALLLLAQSALGVLTGVIGLLMATPLVACCAVLVRELYVEGALGDATTSGAAGE